MEAGKHKSDRETGSGLSVATRRSGILLHVSSLHGDFGTGDFGPGASAFIEFLAEAEQKVWQILPLTATRGETGHSPYSTWSAFAGNILFTDPWQLHDEGLVDRRFIRQMRIKTSETVKYKHALQVKSRILTRAFKTFSSQTSTALHAEFREFKMREKDWLDDYAIFGFLSEYLDDNYWIRWPHRYRERDPSALEELAVKHEAELDQIKFSQFIFSKQWNRIRACAKNHDITILGDLPIYMDHNSVDVWTRPGLFRLHPDKTMKAVAGVPPDYFNAAGQRWGMPVFRWPAMKKEGYAWWLRRIGRNLDWFDLVRLDHFRGFSAYWEIPASSLNGAEGQWVRGPGDDFFDAIRKRYPGMPFIAEDLGMIDQDVHELRDKYELPGMKVIQFGFGEDADTSEHHPSNIGNRCVAYTGTHDNNTLRGWYDHELDHHARRRIEKSLGRKIRPWTVNLVLIKAVMESAAMLTVIPMQDWLGKGIKSRMNHPSTTTGNWLWKLRKSGLKKRLVKTIRDLTRETGRSQGPSA